MHEECVEELVIARVHAAGERDEQAIECVPVFEVRDELTFVAVVEVVGIGGRIRPWVAGALTEDPRDAPTRDQPHETVEVATTRGVPASKLASVALEQRDEHLLHHVAHILSGIAAGGRGRSHQAERDLALNAVEQALGQLPAGRTVAGERARDEVLVGRRHSRRLLRRTRLRDNPRGKGPRATSFTAVVAKRSVRFVAWPRRSWRSAKGAARRPGMGAARASPVMTDLVLAVAVAMCSDPAEDGEPEPAPPPGAVVQATEDERPPLEAQPPDRSVRENPERRRRQRIGRGLLIGGGTALAVGSVATITGIVIAVDGSINGGDGDVGTALMITGAVTAGAGFWTMIAGALVRRSARRSSATPIAAVSRNGAVLGVRLAF